MSLKIMFQFQTHFYFIIINIFGGISKYQDTKKATISLWLLYLHSNVLPSQGAIP